MSEIIVDVRTGVTIVVLPDGKRRLIQHGDTGRITIQVSDIAPTHRDHPEAEVPDRPWQPLQRATAVRNGVATDLGEGEIWKNDLYTVIKTTHQWPGESSEGDEPPVVIHLSIRRNDRHWAKDWRHFQKIKNELVGPECEAVELYPAESRMMDTSNQFHIWVLPEPGQRWPVGYEDGRVTGSEDWMGLGARQRPFADGEVETVTEETVGHVVGDLLDDPDKLRETLLRDTKDKAKEPTQGTASTDSEERE